MSKPKIRFKGYEEDWEQRKLDDLFMERNEQYPMSDDYPLMAFMANVGVAPKGDRYDRSALVHDTKGKKYKRTKKGDFIYSSNNLETGSIGLNNYGNACISPVYSIFKSKHNVDANYLGRILLRKEFIHQMVRYRQGVVYGQWKIHESDFLNLNILVPSLEEQKEIGKYFQNLDHLITLHQRKCEETKKLKKYMLQKMFPQNGKRVPEIRFAGFTDDWEQRKYAEVIELLSGQDFNPEEYNEDGIGIPYLTGASCIENGCTTAVRWTEKPRCIAEKGDTVLVCKGSGYGTIATVNQEKAHIARQFMALKVKKHELDNRFNYFLLNSVVENIKTDARGLIAGIARDAVLKQAIVIPCLNEQTKIGEYFENLDRLITLHQRKYEELQKNKKFMLQNMLI